MTFTDLIRNGLWPATVNPADTFEAYGLAMQPKQDLATDVVQTVDEFLFGGAAGGGKSFWLLAWAVHVCEAHPGNRAIIFRRVMPSLARSLLPRAHEMLAGRARPNSNEHTFTFPNGSVLEFGHLERAESVHRYQGAEYGFVGFEEVTEFLEPQWEFMSTRVRAPVDGVRPHMAATTNPGGVGHRWVKRRWVRPDESDVADGDPKPGERWLARSPDPDSPPVARAFVPATLDDNPALLARDPGYRAKLRAVANRALREAMESGDWDAIDQIEGALWEWPWIEDHRVPSGVVESVGLVRVVVAIDPAASAKPGSDETGIIVVGRGADGRGYVLDDRSGVLSPDQWAHRAVDAYRTHVADRIVAERNNGGDMVTATIVNTDPTVTVSTVWASRGKQTRAEPISVLYEQGRISHVGVFPELEEQLTTWVPGDSDSPDRLDALVWALTELFDAAEQPLTSTVHGGRGAALRRGR